MAYFWLIFDNFNKSVIYFFRIAVKYSYPCNIFNCSKFFYKLRKHFFTINVNTVNRCLLCDKYEFLNAFFSKLFSLLNKIFHWVAPVIATHLWNNAVCAMLITSFCNL